jgi:hypothetical protein
MIYTKVDFNDFYKAFGDRVTNFPLGLRDLFDYLEEVFEGEDHELDVIALCCEFEEGTIQGFLKEYNLDDLKDLEDSTTVIKVDDDNVIIQRF